MDPRSKEEDAAGKYKQSRAMTAGKVQTVCLLLQKAREVVRRIDYKKIDAYNEEIIHCQNIVAQLEMALNFEDGQSAAQIMEMYELIYTGLDHPTEHSLRVVHFLLGHLQETLEIAQKRK